MPGPEDNLLHNRNLCAAVSEKKMNITLQQVAASLHLAWAFAIYVVTMETGFWVKGRSQDRDVFVLVGWSTFPLFSFLLNQKKEELFHGEEPFLKWHYHCQSSVIQGYKKSLDWMSLMIMTHWAEQEMIPLWDPVLPWQAERLEGFCIHTGETAQRNASRALWG